ncbi:SDR family oxidoreductase [Actinosynnema sp.]|uniref:SDR family oxidoreductase n=1 Tax=Actinosynnema sp. TaxID=1872144 RepID=UPI003F824CBF
MTTLITGATGHLGALIADHVLTRIPASELAVSTRSPEKAEALAARGVDVRKADFDDAESLRAAFAGVDRLVLVSADGPDRVAQHTRAVEAAKAAGVAFIAYTSVVDADTSPLSLAPDHAATERVIRESGIAFAFLRNGMYHENYTQALGHGVVAHAAGDGRNASASRDDLAEAAAIVVTGEGHEGKVYELTGPSAWTFAELAALSGDEAKPVTAQERIAGLVGFGLPDFVAELLTDIEVAIGRGALERVTDDLPTLLGRPATPIADAVENR